MFQFLREIDCGSSSASAEPEPEPTTCETECENDGQENLSDFVESGISSTSEIPPSHEKKPVVLFCEDCNPNEIDGPRSVSKYVQTWTLGQTTDIKVQTDPLNCLKCEKYKVTVRQLQQRNSRLLGQQKTQWKAIAYSYRVSNSVVI